jgi:hypothetical protein
MIFKINLYSLKEFYLFFIKKELKMSSFFIDSIGEENLEYIAN